MCRAGNDEVGLCYPPPTGTSLICVNYPDSKTAVRFRTTRPLPPATNSPPNPPPTELLLSDGSWCGSVQAFGPAASYQMSGLLGHDGPLKVSYECDGPMSATFGLINKTSHVWTVKARKTVTQGPLRVRTVKRAWL